MMNAMRSRYDHDSSCTVGILFANPTKSFVKDEILANIEYANERSGRYIDFFFAGFSKYNTYDPQEILIDAPCGNRWHFSFTMFNNFISEIEHVSKWQYSGETELFLLEFSDGKLHFDKAISIWLDRAVREESIYSASTLFEDIYRIARSKTYTSDFRNALASRNAMRSSFQAVCDYIDKHTGNLARATKIYTVKNLSKD
jgi:hypothetical protein